MGNNLFQNNSSAIPGIKRIIILGHSGFIGGHLEKAFQASSKDTEVIGKSLPAIDLTKKDHVDKLAGLFSPETAVIMCAAIKRQFGENFEAFKENLDMTINLCRILSERPVKRFIFFSSSAVYGEDIHNTSISETTPVCPTSYYGIAKFSAERLYRKAGKLKDSLTILRPPLIYGPGDKGKTYGPAGFIKAALGRQCITLWGDGTELREFIFVEDIVRVVCGLLNSDFNGVVNVASGKSHSFQDVLKIVSGLIGEKLDIVSTLRTKDKVDNVFDNRQFLRFMPGFQFTSLEEGIQKTLETETKLSGQTIWADGK